LQLAVKPAEAGSSNQTCIALLFSLCVHALSVKHLPSVVAFSSFAFVSSTTSWVAVPFCMSIFRELALFC
jgi:hypothetical protein